MTISAAMARRAKKYKHRAAVVELADTGDLKSPTPSVYGFDSRRRHQNFKAALCNGSTPDFDSGSAGSNPAAAAMRPNRRSRKENKSAGDGKDSLHSIQMQTEPVK